MNGDTYQVIIGPGAVFGAPVHPFRHMHHTHLVTLKILRRRTHRSTEMPRGCMAPTSTKVVSRMPPQTTKQSKQLKKDET